ncbi:MAG: glucose-6-phosphate isomerase, partial [Tissierellia bacterium]|nr:glucose-6-phosphate isomerase [Tissierellia bacterium]
YKPRLSYLSEWLKQLYGESEGKNHRGIFPASVTNTTDLHSLGQYIQDGQRILFETVIDFRSPSADIFIPNDPANLDGLNYLVGKDLHFINRKAMVATVLAHVEGGVPNILIEVERLNPKTIGKLLYFFMKACGLSGYLLGVNPFNQPGVEEYKLNMFALLGKPGTEERRDQLEDQLNRSEAL